MMEAVHQGTGSVCEAAAAVLEGRQRGGGTAADCRLSSRWR